MIEMNIPGQGIFILKYLVCGINGTFPVEWVLFPGVSSLIKRIQDRLKVYLITANAHGKQSNFKIAPGIDRQDIREGNGSEQKREFVEQLGSGNDTAIGREANDTGKSKQATIGNWAFSGEGIAVETRISSDIVVKDTMAALEYIQNPMRMVVTLIR